jgi:hypothetical protein
LDGPGPCLLVLTTATTTSTKREKLHRSRDFLNHQTDALYMENAQVLGL